MSDSLDQKRNARGRCVIDGRLYDFTNHKYSHYTKLAVCRNCDGLLGDHFKKKCLFSFTTFEYVTNAGIEHGIPRNITIVRNRR